MVTMVDLDFKRIPLINTTNDYVEGKTYRIQNDNKLRYFAFDGQDDKGRNLWVEVPVKLTSWH